jgi:phosphomannomutase
MDDDLHSDIRGVAVPGIEGEPVNLTEPVAEAIAAAFAGWLVEKKKADGSRCLRVSIGHDSRISAQILQVSFLNILVPFGYAISPAVST